MGVQGHFLPCVQFSDKLLLKCVFLKDMHYKWRVLQTDLLVTHVMF